MHAAIEVLLGGLALRATNSVTVVLTGAPAPATVDGAQVGHAAPFLLPRGSTLRLDRPLSGLRTYVAVRGGIDVPAVLGSRATDTLSGLGPTPLQAGDLLPVGTPSGAPTVDVAPVAVPPSRADHAAGRRGPAPRLARRRRRAGDRPVAGLLAQ